MTKHFTFLGHSSYHFCAICSQHMDYTSIKHQGGEEEMLSFFLQQQPVNLLEKNFYLSISTNLFAMSDLQVFCDILWHEKSLGKGREKERSLVLKYLTGRRTGSSFDAAGLSETYWNFSFRFCSRIKIKRMRGRSR